MRVLPISDGKGQIVPFAPGIVLATEAYPEDDLRRSQFITFLMTRAFLDQAEMFEEEERGQIALRLLPGVYEAPDPAEFLRRFAKATTNWSIAGEILQMMLSATIHHPELQITITKAVEAVTRLKDGSETLEGNIARVKIRAAWNVWKRFKSASHLIAVRLNWLRKAGVEDLGESVLREHGRFSIEDIGRFLAVAEKIRKAAVERQIIEHAAAWRVPDDITLESVELTFSPLPENTQRVLSSYRPEHSRDAGLGED